MKKILLFLLIIAAIVFLSGFVLVASPYYAYKKVLENSLDNNWYERSDKRVLVLNPNKAYFFDQVYLDPKLWHSFHLMDTLIALPIKNPFYNVAPDMRYINGKTRIGLVIYGAKGQQISKVYFNQNRLMPNVLSKQKLFSLPIVRKEIIKKSDDLVWKDIFSQKVGNWNISISQMIYNLYLLEMRSQLLPKKALSYRLIKNSNTAIIELESRNKDFLTELVMTRSRGLIYSYFLISKKRNQESMDLRKKLLSKIRFRQGSDYLAKIIYREFAALSYRDKIDQKGMLYLLSAWTHDINNPNFLELMINNLERGFKNHLQLSSLYEYAFKKYGKTFAKKEVKDLIVSSEVLVKIKQEIESYNAKESFEESLKKKDVIEQKSRTMKEIHQDILEKAIDKTDSNKGRMIIN